MGVGDAARYIRTIKVLAKLKFVCEKTCFNIIIIFPFTIEK